MKHFSFFLICLFLYLPSHACSIRGSDFCATASHFSTNPVVHAKLIKEINKGIEVEILKIYRGKVNTSRITIWDGKDWDCNGTFSMKATKLFRDTLQEAILILFPVDTIINEWEKIGDYAVRCLHVCNPALWVEDGRVNGVLQFETDSTQGIYEFSFNSFFRRVKDCAAGDWEISEPVANPNEQLLAYPIPAETTLTIDVAEEHQGSLSFYNMLGQRIYAETPSAWPAEIEVSHLATGVYILILKSDDGILRKKKVQIGR